MTPTCLADPVEVSVFVLTWFCLFGKSEISIWRKNQVFQKSPVCKCWQKSEINPKSTCTAGARAVSLKDLIVAADVSFLFPSTSRLCCQDAALLNFYLWRWTLVAGQVSRDGDNFKLGDPLKKKRKKKKRRLRCWNTACHFNAGNTIGYWDVKLIWQRSHQL